ncbi:MAG TPA: ferrochelatase [Myxococcota bacterium]|nr:ferrochelatase [Myxococcota bacterium]
MRVLQTSSSAKPKLCIFLLQLGGPKDLQAIEPFLRNLFADVLPLPGFLRRPLAAWIARRRTPEVAPLYQEIGGGSPLLANTEAQRAALEARLRDLGFDARVLIAMRYAPPRGAEALLEARAACASAHWLALPLYPQYSYATTRSSLDELKSLLTPSERSRLVVVEAYPTSTLYLDAMANRVRESLDALRAEARREVHLVFSAHGLPLKLVREGDPYPQHVQQTLNGILARLQPAPPHTLCYQSRVGPVKWLTPSTQDTLVDLGKRGVKHVAVVPISFVSEHIETLHELDIQLRDVAKAAGIETYTRVPTVDARPEFIEALAQLVLERLPGSSEDTGSEAARKNA